MSIEVSQNKARGRVGRIIGRVLSGIGIAICALLVVLVIWLCVDKFILKSPVPSVFGYSTLRVATGSMTGTIDQGDFVIIKNTGDYEVDDIVTFLPKGDTTPTTHRIIGLDDEGKFITKGDANTSEDREHITDEQIVGEYVFHVGTGLFVGWVFEMGWIYILAVVLIIAMGIILIKYDNVSQQQAASRASSQSSATESEPNENAEPVTETETSEKAEDTGESTESQQ